MTGSAERRPDRFGRFLRVRADGERHPVHLGLVDPVRHRVPERECQPVQCHLEGIYPDIHRLLVLRRRLFGRLQLLGKFGLDRRRVLRRDRCDLNDFDRADKLEHRARKQQH